MFIYFPVLPFGSKLNMLECNYIYVYARETVSVILIKAMAFEKSSILVEATVWERGKALISRCVLMLMQISAVFEICIYDLLVYHLARLETHTLFLLKEIDVLNIDSKNSERKWNKGQNEGEMTVVWNTVLSIIVLLDNCVMIN